MKNTELFYEICFIFSFITMIYGHVTLMLHIVNNFSLMMVFSLMGLICSLLGTAIIFHAGIYTIRKNSVDNFNKKLNEEK